MRGLSLTAAPRASALLSPGILAPNKVGVGGLSQACGMHKSSARSRGLPSSADFRAERTRFSGIKKDLHRSFSTRTPPADMKFSRLGDSDLMVSRCCLGSMTWGQQNTTEEGIEQLNIAFDEYGVNFVDTAEMYPIPIKAETQGATDRIIAKWLATRNRHKVVLASKVCGYSDSITWLPGRSGGPARVNAQQIRDSVHESLKRLGTDYIDLIQIHWPDRYVPLFGQGKWNKSLEREHTPVEEQLAAFKKLVDEGKIRYVGVSNETPFGVCKFVETAERMSLPKIVSIQNCYSLINRVDFEAGLLETCSPRNHNVGLLPYSPLAGGVLTGKYATASDTDVHAKQWRLNLFPGYMSRYKQSLASEAIGLYCDAAKRHDMTPSEFSLAFCNSREFVTSTIIGATSVQQLRENLGAFGKQWTEQMEEEVDGIYKRYKDPSKSD